MGVIMKKKHSDWPEIVFSSSDVRLSQAISRALKAGLLWKIAPRIYISNLTDNPEEIIKKHRYYV